MCLSWTQAWKEEFKDELTLMKLRLSLSRPELLLQPQWDIPPWAWQLYRLFMLLYTLAWSVYSGLLFSSPKWLIFFSHLTYCLMGVYHLVALANLLWATVLARRCCREHRKIASGGDGREHGSESLGPFPLPLPSLFANSLRLQWCLHSLTCAFSLTVSLLYWSIDYPIEHHPLSPFNINMHVGNSAQTLLDLLLSATPVHLAHYLYQLVIGCLYILFAIVYWLAGFTNLSGEPYIYKVLDFGGRPLVASVCVLGFALICLPLCHFLVWNLYVLRRQLVSRVRGGRLALRREAWWWRGGGGEGPLPVSLRALSSSPSLFTPRRRGAQGGVTQSLVTLTSTHYSAVTIYL